jgi:hypothetical protein
VADLQVSTLTPECRFFGYGMVAVGLTFVPVATMTYVSDCYLPVNADALLLVNGLKVRYLSDFSVDLTLTTQFGTEHRGFRILTRSRRMGGDRLRQRIRHPSWSLRRSIGPGHPSGSVRRENPAQDCAVEDHFVSGIRKAACIVLIRRVPNRHAINFIYHLFKSNFNPSQ